MKKILVLATLLSLGIAFGASALRVSAQAPTNTFPGAAVGADNLSHFIPGGAHLWYFFQYAGDNSQYGIVLVNGAKDNLDFKLYLPTQITLPNDFDSDHPIARGGKSGIACPAGQDTCDATNNRALGPVSYKIAGRYYVEVINNNPDGKAFLLQINGPRDSISLQPPTPTVPVLAVATNTPLRAAPTATPNAILTLMAQVAATLKAPLPTDNSQATPTTSAIAPAPAPTSAPPPTDTPVPAPTATAVALVVPSATPTPDNFYWTNAMWVYDSRLRVLPPKTDSWFKFEVSGDKDRPITTVTVPDAKLSGIEVHVYTSQQAQNYANEDKFIGVGTQPTLNCNDGTKCTSNDAVWSGALSSADTLYLRVTNTSDKYANLRLVVTGANVVLGH
jgi:hypothetical protein